VSYRIVISESKTRYPAEGTKSPIVEWTETDAAETESRETAAGILRAIASRLHPVKDPREYM
jgi:hypothetical protein